MARSDLSLKSSVIAFIIALSAAIAIYLQWIPYEPLLGALIWRPAFASWWIFLIVLIKSLRMGKKKFLLVATLPLFQFLLMILITFAQDMRFQYGVILCALFSTALFFIPEKG